jgi:hypothetical protein
MVLKSKLNEMIGNYCFVSSSSSKVILIIPPSRTCRNDSGAVEFTKQGKFGFPCKVSKVGDDCFEVEYFGSIGGGWGGIGKSTFSLTPIEIQEMI